MEQEHPVNLPPAVKVSKWKNPDYSKEKFVDELLGKTVDGVIVSWRENESGSGKYSGFIRPDGYGRHGSKDGIFIGFEEVLSDIAPEVIHVGTRVRFTVTPVKPGTRSLRATNIDVYKD